MKIGDFERINPVPEEGIARVVEIMRTGRMFRYSGEQTDTLDATLLERDFARLLGVPFALGLNSCSSAILLALKACGVTPGDKVLLPAFTFTAVPAAVLNAGAIPVLVECNRNYRVSIDDLRKKIAPDIRVFLLSHMRGYTSDMDRIVDICEEHGIILIEDAAHSLGVRWRGKPAGSFGRAGCFSFQSYKIVDSGEGGMLTTHDEEVAVRATYLSGSYERLFTRHMIESDLFEALLNREAPYNLRMTNVAAAIVRSQLDLVEARGECYRSIYRKLVAKLSACGRVEFPEEDSREERIPDSIQFRIAGFSAVQMNHFGERVRLAGLPVSLPGADKDNARAFWNWRYLGETPDLPETRAALANTCDMRLRLSTTDEQIDYVAEVILGAIRLAETTLA